MGSYSWQRLAGEWVEGMEGVGGDSREVVEGGVNWVELVDSSISVERQGGDGREGSEGLERQQVVLSQNSPSHELSRGSQADGCQGELHHGLT